MQTIIILPKQTLKKLRKSLPHGAIDIITTRTGYHRNYVSMILTGERNINEKNEIIIREAKRIIGEGIKKTEKKSKKLMELINKPQMQTTIIIPKETLKKFKKSLPHGAIGMIATRTGYHRNYVSMILTGERNINEENEIIIREAKKIIEERIKKLKKNQ